MKKKLIGLTENQCEWLEKNCEPRRHSEIVRRALDFYIEAKNTNRFKQEYQCEWIENIDKEK